MTDRSAMWTWIEAAKRQLDDIEERAFAIVRRRQVYMLEGGTERRRHPMAPACRDCPHNRRDI